MSKINQTANEAQLKARRTSLGKKSNEELINIILRKDKTERSQSAKINSLMELLNEADKLNEEKATRIFNFDKDMEGMQELVKVKQEQIDKLICDLHTSEEAVKDWSRKYVNVLAIAKLRKKVVFTCFGIITILIILLICL